MIFDFHTLHVFPPSFSIKRPEKFIALNNDMAENIIRIMQTQDIRSFASFFDFIAMNEETSLNKERFPVILFKNRGFLFL